MKCLWCGKLVVPKSKRQKKFCNRKCYKTYANKNKIFYKNKCKDCGKPCRGIRCRECSMPNFYVKENTKELREGFGYGVSAQASRWKKHKI